MLPLRAVDCCRSLKIDQKTEFGLTWFDGPLLAGQNALGTVGLLFVPILGGPATIFLSDPHLANLLQPCVPSAALGTITLIRLLA